jgi:hypothetical protein
VSVAFVPAGPVPFPDPDSCDFEAADVPDSTGPVRGTCATPGSGLSHFSGSTISESGFWEGTAESFRSAAGRGLCLSVVAAALSGPGEPFPGSGGTEAVTTVLSLEIRLSGMLNLFRCFESREAKMTRRTRVACIPMLIIRLFGVRHFMVRFFPVFICESMTAIFVLSR